MKDKIVLVTGGSSGLGLATTKAFLEEGAIVIVASRSEQKFEENLGKATEQLHFIETDFNYMAAVKHLHQKIAQDFKRLDMAINNVGAAPIKALTDFEEEDFDYIFNVNLKSLWLSIKHQIPLMLQDQNTPKHILNVSSVNGLGGAEFASLYAAAKAGVISLTKSAALELAQSNISINALVPGAFDTPMLNGAIRAQAQGDPEMLKAVEARYKEFIPKGRFGDPAEFAQTVLWLCQGKSNYISGHSLIIDGGMSSRHR